MSNVLIKVVTININVFFSELNLVDCEWDSWVNGSCSEPCGKGVQIDHRKKLREEAYDGKPCNGTATRQSDCKIKECPSMETFLHMDIPLVVLYINIVIRIFEILRILITLSFHQFSM